jgi:hypothetical protein
LAWLGLLWLGVGFGAINLTMERGPKPSLLMEQEPLQKGGLITLFNTILTENELSWFGLVLALAP